MGEREEVSGGKKINYIKQIKKTCKSEAPQKLLFHLLVAGLKKIWRLSDVNCEYYLLH